MTDAGRARLLNFAQQLEDCWGCEHEKDFNEWCPDCRDQVVADIRLLTGSGGGRQDVSGVPRLAENDAALIGVMTQRCIDRACEGGDENDAQADSAECCLQFYGQDLVRWCDMCLMSAAINSLKLALAGSAPGDAPCKAVRLGLRCPTCESYEAHLEGNPCPTCSAAARPSGDPPRQDVLTYAECRNCSTATWCAHFQKCLAESQPGEGQADAPAPSPDGLVFPTPADLDRHLRDAPAPVTRTEKEKDDTRSRTPDVATRSVTREEQRG